MARTIDWDTTRLTRPADDTGRENAESALRRGCRALYIRLQSTEGYTDAQAEEAVREEVACALEALARGR